MSQVVIIKLPSGSNAPIGYELVKTLRGTDIYHKTIRKVSASDINDLNNLFDNLGINASENVAIVPEVDEDAFMNALIGNMAEVRIGTGGKRRKSRKGRKSRKSRKGRKSRRM